MTTRTTSALDEQLAGIGTRVSCPAVTEPGPTRGELEAMLRAACRAPDHGALRPWRFTILQGADLELLADAYEACVVEHDPDAGDEERQRARSKALRAPTVVVLWAQITPDHPKVPKIEQLLATGAVGQNLLLAASQLGFGAMWRTGASAYSDAARTVLGLPSGAPIIGFFFLGTPRKALKAVPPTDLDDFLHEPDRVTYA